MKNSTPFSRMKHALTLLILLLSPMIRAQNDPSELSPGGRFDQVFDKYGNTYKLEDVMISSKPKVINGLSVSTQTLCTNSGYFDLYFETGSGCEGTSTLEIARRNVLCQLFSDISNFIVPANPSTHVNIWVRNIANITSTNGVLGLASSFYTLPSGAPNVGGIVDGEVWKTIHSGVDSYTNVASPLVTTGGTNLGFYHGIVAFDFTNYTWHTNLGAPTTTGAIDLYSVGLHEVIHALGFASLINYNGTSKLGTNNNYYSRYDLFLQTQSGVNLITNPGLCSLYDYSFNPLLNANTLLSPNPASCGNVIPYSGSLNNTTCGTAVKFAGSVNQTVYTPNCFEPPSSLSHLEDLCHLPTASANDAYYVMSNANGAGPAYMKRFPKPEERMVLCDIGYRVNTTYGNNLYTDNFKDYQVAQCPGLWVGGVNDGITSTGGFAWTTAVGAPTTILGSTILGNDFQATAFECLEDVYGMGILNTSSGNGSTVITYTPSLSGVALLRYVPVNSNGDRGNITYVYVFVTAPGCTPSACNMVSNGEFESVVANCGQVMATVVNCWTRYTSSPDLFGRNCPGQTIPTVATYANPAADTWNNGANANNHFVGLWGYANGASIDEESIQTTLSTPLIQGGQYTLRFQARVSNGSGYANVPANIAICGSANTMASAASNYNITNPNLTVLTTTVIPADMAWHAVTITFTYTGTLNLNNLIIGYDASASPNATQRYVFLDAFELSPSLPSVTFTPPTPTCVGAVIYNFDAYANPPGGTITGTGISGSPGSYVFTAGSAGTYTLNYNYQNNVGCTANVPAAMTVTVTPSPTITVVASPSVSCAGAPVTLSASGASSYVWSPAVSCSAPCNIVTINPFSNVTYTVTGTNGQCSSSTTFSMSVNTPTLCCKPANTIVPNGATSTTYPSFASGLVVDISGVYTINTNVTYTGVNFRMLPGSKINVNAGNALTLVNCHLFSCSDMWDGIYLLQSGTTGGNIYMNGCTLEDAINGVVANSNNTTANSLLRAINTTFNKNLNSIQYLNYTGTALANLDIQQSRFTCANSPYSFGATLKAPYLNQRSQKGVVLNTVNNVQVGSSTSATLNNRFDNLDYGIHALNTNVKIINNTFTMTGGLNGTVPLGVGIYSPNAALAVKTMTIGGTATNEPNTFTDVFRGVDITNISQTFITKNRFTATMTPASFPSGTMGLTSHQGINLANIRDVVSVISNTLTNYAYGITHIRNLSTATAYNPQIQHNKNVLNTNGTGTVIRGIYIGDAAANIVTGTVLIEIRDNNLIDMRDYGIVASNILNGAQIIGSSPNTQLVQMRYQAGFLQAAKAAIIATGCNKTFIAYNALYSTSSGNTGISGIILRTSLNSMVKCNNIYTIGSCIAVDGDCTGPYTSATSYTCGIVNNKFQNAQIGISLINNGKVGQQGDATHPTENVWNGTAASYTNGQTNVGINSSALNSIFYCRTTPTSLWPTNHIGVFSVPYANNTSILPASGTLPACPVATASLVVIPSDARDQHAAQHTGQLSLTQMDITDFNVNVYPNPNNGLFTLAADVEMTDVTVRVCNLMGEVLYEKTFKTFSSQEINLSEYSNGVYNIRINDANYTRYYKVIKQ